jgi:hypothetical protein
MNKYIASCLLSLLAIPAFSGDANLAAVEAAAQKWSSSGIVNYRFTLTLRENWGAASTALVIVKDGNLESAGIIIRRSNPIPESEASENSGLRRTITNLFADMWSRDDFLRATFDETTGRPIDIVYKHPDWEDAENQYEIRDFIFAD